VKTVEERAEALAKLIMDYPSRPMEPMIEETLRLLIEDCAKICDEQAGAMHGVLIDAGNDYRRAAKASAARDMARKIGRRIREAL